MRRRLIAAGLLAAFCLTVPAPAPASVRSADGITIWNTLADFTLRASAAFVDTSAVASTAVSGFGGVRVAMFELSVTAVSLTGGSGPTVVLKVWVQRKTPAGQWDDMLAFQTAALSSGASALYHVAEHVVGVAAGSTPALIQDAGGAPPFASRSGWISDDLRVKAVLVTSGSPTAQSVTWSLTARGRP